MSDQSACYSRVAAVTVHRHHMIIKALIGLRLLSMLWCCFTRGSVLFPQTLASDFPNRRLFWDLCNRCKILKSVDHALDSQLTNVNEVMDSSVKCMHE